MKLKYFIIIYFSICCSSLWAQSAKGTGNWLQHTDTTYNFTVQYPGNWEFKLPGTNTRFFITSYLENDADSFRENINCIARKIDQPDFTIRSAEAAIKSSIEKKMENYTLIKSGYVKWNNTDALQLNYTCNQQSGGSTFQIHLFQQMAVVNGVLYVLTFTSEIKSYDKYIELVKKVISSFKVN